MTGDHGQPWAISGGSLSAPCSLGDGSAAPPPLSAARLLESWFSPLITAPPPRPGEAVATASAASCNAASAASAVFAAPSRACLCAQSALRPKLRARPKSHSNDAYRKVPGVVGEVPWQRRHKHLFQRLLAARAAR